MFLGEDMFFSFFRRFLFLLTFLFLMLNSQHVFAALGKTLASYELYSGHCILEFFNKHGVVEEHCSGTVVSAHQILTAAHCMKSYQDDHDYVRISCNGKEVELIESPFVHPEFNFSLIKNDDHRFFDLAVLEISDTLDFYFPNRVVSEDEFKHLLENTDWCAVTGFGGIFSGQDGYAQPRGVFIDPKSIQFSGHELRVNSVFPVVTGLVEPGDSGGSLLCELDQVVYQVGVVSGRNYSYESIFAPVYGQHLNFHPLISSEPQMSARIRAWRIKQERFADQVKTCFQKNKVRFEINNQDNFFNVDFVLNKILDEKLSSEIISLNLQVDDQLKALEQVCYDERKGQILKNLDKPYKVLPYTEIEVSLNLTDFQGLFNKNEVNRLLELGNPFSTADHIFNQFIILKIEGNVVSGNLKLFGFSENWGCAGRVLCSNGNYYHVQVPIDRLTR